MTSIVESYLGTMADSAMLLGHAKRRGTHAKRLLRALASKKSVLVTTHTHPDPDALASCQAMVALLSDRLPQAKVQMSINGTIAGGINEAFTRLSNLKFAPWRDSALSNYDAIVLLDTQPQFAYSPLPPQVTPTAIIDHHRTLVRGAKIPFRDVRTDVGATSTIIYSYFVELGMSVAPELAATLLFAIESDLAGKTGQPGELDNLALSSLTLIANTNKLYKMRYVDVPQDYFIAYAQGLKNAVYYDNAIMSHLESITSLEKPAVIADFLLRFEAVQWSLVTALSSSDERPTLVLSLRTSTAKLSAAALMRRLIRHIGEGGGHVSKAGGVIRLESGSAAEIDRFRKILRRRYLRSLGIKASRGQKLVP